MALSCISKLHSEMLCGEKAKLYDKVHTSVSRLFFQNNCCSTGRDKIIIIMEVTCVWDAVLCWINTLLGSWIGLSCSVLIWGVVAIRRVVWLVLALTSFHKTWLCRGQVGHRACVGMPAIRALMESLDHRYIHKLHCGNLMPTNKRILQPQAIRPQDMYMWHVHVSCIMYMYL